MALIDDVTEIVLGIVGDQEGYIAICTHGGVAATPLSRGWLDRDRPQLVRG